MRSLPVSCLSCLSCRAAVPLRLQTWSATATRLEKQAVKQARPARTVQQHSDLHSCTITWTSAFRKLAQGVWHLAGSSRTVALGIGTHYVFPPPLPPQCWHDQVRDSAICVPHSTPSKSSSLLAGSPELLASGAPEAKATMTVMPVSMPIAPESDSEGSSGPPDSPPPSLCSPPPPCSSPPLPGVSSLCVFSVKKR